MLLRILLLTQTHLMKFSVVLYEWEKNAPSRRVCECFYEHVFMSKFGIRSSDRDRLNPLRTVLMVNSNTTHEGIYRPSIISRRSSLREGMGLGRERAAL